MALALVVERKKNKRKLYRFLSIGMALPDFANLKTVILAAVVATILIVAGWVAINLAYGMGIYVYKQINSTIQQPVLVPASNLQILGTGLLIAGITVIVALIAVMIYYLMRGIPEATAT